MVGVGQTGRVTVDGWLEMNAPAQTAVLFKELRGALDSVLQERIGMPQVRVCWSQCLQNFVQQKIRVQVNETSSKVDATYVESFTLAQLSLSNQTGCPPGCLCVAGEHIRAGEGAHPVHYPAAN